MCKIVSGVVIVLGLGFIIAGAVVGWVVYPKLIQDQVELKDGTEQYKRFVNFPIPINFSVYVFDIQNKDEILAGEAKPKVLEKGPYVYKETRKKNISSHSSSTITYKEFQGYTFNQNFSGDLREDDEVTILNPVLTSVVQLSDNPMTAMLFNRYYKESFGNHPHPFLRTHVGNLMFDGYKFCEQNDNLLCFIIWLKVKDLKNIQMNTEENSLSFTFFNHKKDKDDGKYKINDGVEDVSKLGYIEEWNDSKYLKNMWKGEHSKCNEVKGRDSIIYPPFIKEEDVITIFNTDICRTVDLVFSEEKTYKDANSLKYVVDKKTLNSPDSLDNCYCLNETHGFDSPGCVKDGLMELKNCYGVPVLLSWPHFMWADQEIIQEVDGVKPDESKHLIYVELEPTTGTPFRGFKRMQLSMFLRPSTNYTLLENAKDTIIPLIWVEEAIEINRTLYDTLNNSFLKIKDIVEIGRWAMIGVGVAAVLIGVIMCFCCRKKK